MKATELTIAGAWVIEPQVFPDKRGRFAAPYQADAFRETLGFELHVAQVNQSVSARGVVRGVHFADVPPGQAKYAYCTRGALLDVIVDVRIGSPTYGLVEAVELDAASSRAVYLAEGLGHAFVALEDDTAMTYLCSTGYRPGAEHGIHPLDPELDLPWPTGLEPILSEKDAAAPTLAQAHADRLLPTWDTCQARYTDLLPVTVTILGAGGQLGRALAALLTDARALHRADLDITDAAAVAAHDWSGVDVLINAAAYTAVDRAETPEGRIAAWAANATAVAHLAAAANAHDMTLVHVSSEYVFDGMTTEPILEDAPLCPLGAYGASKAAGEIAASLAARHLVVRTTWIVGDGANFVRTMLGLAARGVRPAVVDDQIGRPTFAADLAAGIVALRDAPAGVYHLSNTGEPASWAEVARATYALAGRDPFDVTGTTTAAYFADKPQAARRPLNSVLDLTKAATAGVVLPPWHESLAGYLKEEVA